MRLLFRRAFLREPIGTWLGTRVSRSMGYLRLLRDRSRVAPEEANRFLAWCFYLLRVGTMLTVLLVASFQPSLGRLGYSVEANILLFAAYNVVIELIRRRLPGLYSIWWVCILDLPAVLLLYALGAAPGGLTYVLVFLDVICAAISMPLRAVLAYTAVVSVSIGLIDPTLPLWSHDVGDIRRLSGRLLVLALTALGTAILTQRLRLEQAAAQSGRDETMRLTELDRLRTEFVQSVSHDLRTPLAGARAGIGLLEVSVQDRLQPNEQELVGSIRRNIHRLGRLIDDLLTLNQLEAGALHLTCVPFDLRKCVTDLLPTMYLLLREKDQILEVDLSEPLPVVGDTRRLEQVMMNLLVNASQHTPRGTRISVSGREAGDVISLTVSDTGPGIPVEERELIFERFYQRGVGRGSAGLGLAIVKSIIALHHGRIRAEQALPHGAAFQIEIPRDLSGGSI